MKIDAIKLSGWRSYDLDGIHIEGLKSINLIIGPNNSGKSNLSKYFNYLKGIAGQELPNGEVISVAAELNESHTWGWEKSIIKCEVSLSHDNSLSEDHKVGYKANEHQIALDCTHDVKSDSSILNLKINNNKLFDDRGQILESLDNCKRVDPTDSINGYCDLKHYWKCFLDSLVFVDPIRHHSRQSDNVQDYYFDGAEIIQELDKLRRDKATPSNWADYKSQVKQWLTDILSEKVINIEVVEDDLSLEFESGLSFSLEQLGTGVSQIVMLLSHLWINRDMNLNVFLEEPEANLHPEAVIKLVNIFEKNLKNHKFFITTHSPSLIDCLNENWAVYRTLKSDEGASQITPNDNVIKYYETLDSLGVKASQILQANTVLWVEGPSDRIYLKKWIDIFSNEELKEGKDYSFLYFGGTNLASFTVLEDIDPSLINMLSTSRKAYLITDSDCSSQTELDNEGFKRYLESMLERVNKADAGCIGTESSLDNYFKVWITGGREIENYLCKDLLFDILIAKGFKRDVVGKKDCRKLLELKAANSSDFIFNQFDSFDKAIANCYQFADKSPLDESTLNNIALSYAGKKVSIAKAVSEKLTKLHCTPYDLQEQITNLVKFIRA
ncbi:AAA family ATPase [Pseudoalteromonas neustonica]|uniref:AAA family ATPase n=1 Tax=Pseudoalteromonas neustonica TaxID=1840331 RepID=UPI0007DB31D3|nr:ATP-binding protein [Pseudoalteromonas neustonica]